MADERPRVRAIQGAVKDYAWGIRGLDSRVARYALESGSIEGVDPAAPYAELWMGTHPSVSAWEGRGACSLAGSAVWRCWAEL